MCLSYSAIPRRRDNIKISCKNLEVHSKIFLIPEPPPPLLLIPLSPSLIPLLPELLLLAIAAAAETELALAAPFLALLSRQLTAAAAKSFFLLAATYNFLLKEKTSVR